MSRAGDEAGAGEGGPERPREEGQEQAQGDQGYPVRRPAEDATRGERRGPCVCVPVFFDAAICYITKSEVAAGVRSCLINYYSTALSPF